MMKIPAGTRIRTHDLPTLSFFGMWLQTLPKYYGQSGTLECSPKVLGWGRVLDCHLEVFNMFSEYANF